jgi:branched-chain amino acid transport system permease protein
MSQVAELQPEATAPPAAWRRVLNPRVRGMLKFVVVVLLALELPQLLSPSNQNIVDLALLAALGALGLNLVLGIAGQVSIANAAFLAVGGYVAATFGGIYEWPVIPTILIAGVVGAVIGAAVGLPSLRLRGIYLVVATLALHYIVLYVVQRYQTERVGPGGFSLPIADFFGKEMIDYHDWYYVLVVFVGLAVIAIKNLMRTSFGRAWLAIRSAEPAAEIIGVNVARYKILAFVLSAFICSVEGALFAYFNGAVSYETFTLAVAVQYAAMVVIGGMGSIIGSILGAALLTSLPFLMDNILSGRAGAQSANIQLMIYGLAMVGFILFAPEGIAGLGVRVKNAVLRAARRGRRPRPAPPPAPVGAPPAEELVPEVSQ